MRKIILSFTCILSILGCCLLGGAKVSDFTVEEHIQRITERIENSEPDPYIDWYFSEGETYQSFEVYPLYDQNEEVTFYLIEFDPHGFVFVRTKDETYGIGGCVKTGMYLLSSVYGRIYPWAPYIADKNGAPIGEHPLLSVECNLLRFFSSDKKGDLILDEKGELIIYEKSPYFVTGNINEKKYLIKTITESGYKSSEYICAVKKDGKFINLMSEGLEFEEAEEYKVEENATIYPMGVLTTRAELK